MDLGLRGRTALVTGAASGIGQATATVLAAEGARVVGLDHDKAGLDTTIAGLTLQPGSRPHVAVAADLATAAGVSAGIADAVSAAPVIDIVVSNAGTCQFRSLDDLDDHDWDATIELNLMAAVRILRLLLPRMRAAGHGSYVFIASDLALQPEVSPPDYAVSKVGLVSLVKSTALAEGPGIRVNAVAPGPIETPLWTRPGGIDDNLAALYGEPRGKARQLELAKRQLPLGRIGQPEEAARVAAFLASDAASYVTGSLWPVDGGSRRGL